MKKSILFLIMMLILSTNLYAEELHYHKDMWCLNPDGTHKVAISKNNDGSIYMLREDGAIVGYEYYKKVSLQAAFKAKAEYYGIPAQIPSKKTEYDSKANAEKVIVEPVSSTQIYMYSWQEGAEAHILMTYNPATKTTRETTCESLP